jgi:hypothetical protein
MSEYATLWVMRSDVGASAPRLGSTFFPSPGRISAAERSAPVGSLAQRTIAIPGLSRAALQLLDTAALQDTLQELYAQLRGPAPAGGELHPNGTLRIPSLVAVWLMGRVSQAYKPGSKLVKLSRALDPEMLRSIGGVADLLIRAIRADVEGSHA